LHQEKEQYSVQMTHQLKNPLDAIRSNISLLLYYKEQEMPPGASDLLHRIDVRAKGMANLIVDVLKLSRLNAPVEKLVMQQVDIHEIVKTAVDELKSSAGSRKVTIETLLNQASVPGIADHYKMLVENLLANAITYSHDGGHVSIVCSTDEALNCAVMSVTDQGIGIAEDKLPHIFDEYFRTKEAITHNRASTGIGLAIVKKIAQTYGIQVSIKSELGKGTTVTAVFPRVQTSNAGPTAIAQETDASTIDQ
jgi:signal transduction histidine kinase